MKPQIILGVLLAMTIGSVSATRADCDCCCRPSCSGWREAHLPAKRGPGQCDRDHEELIFLRFEKALGLTELQKIKIEALLMTERDKSASLRQKLEDTWKQLRQAEQAAKFDESAVRTIAARQAHLVTEMTTIHARVQNQIHALLTPEQRVRADYSRPPMKDGGPGCFPPPMDVGAPGCFPPPPEWRSSQIMRHCDGD